MSADIETTKEDMDLYNMMQVYDPGTYHARVRIRERIHKLERDLADAKKTNDVLMRRAADLTGHIWNATRELEVRKKGRIERALETLRAALQPST